MGDIVNLNRARKERARALDKARAAANRIAHGRTRAEKQTTARNLERADRLLDGQKRDRPHEDGAFEALADPSPRPGGADQ